MLRGALRSGLRAGLACVIAAASGYAQTIHDYLADIQRSRGIGDTEAALRIADRAVAEFPDRPEGYLERGTLLAEAGRYEEAGVALRKGIGIGSSPPAAHLALAKVLLSLHQYTDALDESERFASLAGEDSQSFELHYLRGLVLRRLGRREAARQELQTALEIRPGHADALLNMGAVLDEMGMPEQALRWLDKAANLDGRNPDVRYRKAKVLARLGRSEEADRELAAFSAIRQEAQREMQVNLLVDQAKTSLQAGDAAKAKDLLQQALRLDPEHAHALGNLGMAYESLGAGSLARAMFEKAASLDPQYAEAHLNLGLKLAEAGDFAAALESIEHAVTVSPELAGARKALGMVLTRLGRSREARPHFEWIVQQEPSSAAARLDLGIALAESGLHSEALAEFEQAAAIEPGSFGAHYNRGRALRDVGRRDAAREALATAIGLNSRFVPALQLMASIEREAGNTERAVEVLRSAVEADGSNPQLHHELALAMNEAGLTLDAVQHWEEVLLLDPLHEEALYNLAQALQETDEKRSGTYLRRFSELKAERQNTDRAGTLWNFAIAEAEQARWKEAFVLFRQALAECGACPARGQIHKNFGLVYGHSGDYQSAELQLQKAAELMPDDTEVREALAIVRSGRER